MNVQEITAAIETAISSVKAAEDAMDRLGAMENAARAAVGAATAAVGLADDESVCLVIDGQCFFVSGGQVTPTRIVRLEELVTDAGENAAACT